MIDGVAIRALVTHGDDRGFFRELLRATDPAFADGFGQLSHSLVRQGVVKAWHAHVVQYQWTYMINGVFRVALHDHRSTSSTFRETVELVTGDGHPPQIYGFPPGVLHGYECVTGPGHVIYLTSGHYDLADEVRIAADDPTIPFRWS